jgi:hypothetical protein
MVTGMLDGSVRLTGGQISNPTWLAVITPNDGQAPGSDWEG